MSVLNKNSQTYGEKKKRKDHPHHPEAFLIPSAQAMCVMCICPMPRLLLWACS